MADLVKQINEMLKILEVIDPRAAAEIRGVTPARQTAFAVPEAATAKISIPEPRLIKTVRISEPLAPEAKFNPLILNLTPDNLIQGIILSEVLRPPKARKRSFRRT